MRRRNGFTLLEMVIVIFLTSILILVLFQALDRIRENEQRFKEKKDQRKDIYMLYSRLAPMFRNTSHFSVFNNRSYTPYFLGTSEGVVFVSRSPLVYPYDILHFIELRFYKNRILYREKLFRHDKRSITFEELEDERFYTLLEDVERAEFLFYLWDTRTRKYIWRNTLNTFDRDIIPKQVALNMEYRGRTYGNVFHMKIKDKNEEIPTHLLQQ